MEEELVLDLANFLFDYSDRGLYVTSYNKVLNVVCNIFQTLELRYNSV
jgi:hypothetical protein